MPKLKSEPEFVEICIELKPYLIKYATAGNPGNYIFLNHKDESDILWNKVVTMLGTPPRGWKPERIPTEKRLALRLPYWYIRDNRLGRWISNRNKVHLAELIEITFWKDLYESVIEQKLDQGRKELVVIREFRAEFGITEDDYLEESMYKRYRRCKAKRLKRRKIREGRAI